jgi:hypothetical protein
VFREAGGYNGLTINLRDTHVLHDDPWWDEGPALCVIEGGKEGPCVV